MYVRALRLLQGSANFLRVYQTAVNHKSDVKRSAKNGHMISTRESNIGSNRPHGACVTIARPRRHIDVVTLHVRAIRLWEGGEAQGVLVGPTGREVEVEFEAEAKFIVSEGAIGVTAPQPVSNLPEPSTLAAIKSVLRPRASMRLRHAYPFYPCISGLSTSGDSEPFVRLSPPFSGHRRSSCQCSF